MRIGYGKIGRSMPLTLEKCGNLGGDVEMAAVAGEFARRHPADEIVLIGRNTGEHPTDVGLPENVTNPWTKWAPRLRGALNAQGLNYANLSIDSHLAVQKILDDLTLETFVGLDAIILWVGQHGTTNMPLPKVTDPTKLTKPHDAFAYYSGYLLRGVNFWRDAHDPRTHEEIYLNADARNRHKMRDLKWPLQHPILTQFTFDNRLKHHRFGDDDPADWATQFDAEVLDEQTWRSTVHNVYSRLEVNGLRPGTPFGDLISFSDDWHRPGHFGMFINEARANGIRPEHARAKIVTNWVLPLTPHFLHGSWSKESLATMEVNIEPAPWHKYYPMLHAVKSTFTTPSSGSGWATAKPWEAFAGGTVCFFHPAYDTQDNILGDAPDWLRAYLRVDSPAQLRQRVNELDRNPSLWYDLVHAQREHFQNALAELRYMKMIEERIYG